MSFNLERAHASLEAAEIAAQEDEERRISCDQHDFVPTKPGSYFEWRSECTRCRCIVHRSYAEGYADGLKARAK